MAKKKDPVTLIDTLLTELLTLLNVEATFEINYDEPKGDEEKTIFITLEAPSESGLLIGSRGQTLNAIQSFLAMSLRQSLGEWVRVNLDVGAWKERHEEYLSDLALQAAERARHTKEPQHLYNLNPAQRRVVHLVLSKEKGIETESQGEGENRYLIVKPK